MSTPSAARRRHLVLVGLMGAGKSTVGRRCAETLGRPFTDTDELVELQAGASIAEIFARDGEARFRSLEKEVIADACASVVPMVIACGGGAVVDSGNRRCLRENGHVVWLRAPAAALKERVRAGAGRPLLAIDPAAALERLAALRADAYVAAAHATVDTEGRSVEEVADLVLVTYAGEQ